MSAFNNKAEAIQHLADYTGKKIIIAISEEEQELIEIAKDPQEAYGTAAFLLKRFKDVPEVIINSIAQDPDLSYKYAELLKGKDVPEAIVEGITKDKYRTYDYADYILKNKNVPDIIIKTIAQDPKDAYEYAEEALKWKNIPKVIVEGIAQDPESALKYADVFNLFYDKENKVFKEKSMSDELKFGSVSEAIQHLADYTGERIVIGASLSEMQRRYDNMVPDSYWDGDPNLSDIFEDDLNTIERDLKESKQEVLNMLSKEGISNVTIDFSDFEDYTLTEEDKYVWTAGLNVKVTIKGEGLEKADEVLKDYITNPENVYEPGDGVFDVFFNLLELDEFNLLYEGEGGKNEYDINFSLSHDGNDY